MSTTKDKLKSQESVLIGQHIDADEEKLHLIEGGIEQANEEEAEVVDEGKLGKYSLFHSNRGDRTGQEPKQESPQQDLYRHRGLVLRGGARGSC